MQTEQAKEMITKQNAENLIWEIEKKIQDLRDVIIFLKDRQREIQLEHGIPDFEKLPPQC